MTDVNDLFLFAGVMALAQFSPGPDMILLTRTALRSGARAGVQMAAGITCGLLVHATIALGGLALAFQRIPLLAHVLRWGAAAYLSWIAWTIVREHFVRWYAGATEQPEVVSSRRQPFLRGLFCNLLNPKVVIFFAAVCAPFLNGDHPRYWPWALGGIIVIQGFSLWSLWACLLRWPPLARRYGKMERGIDLTFAVVLVGLAVALVAGGN